MLWIKDALCCKAWQYCVGLCCLVEQTQNSSAANAFAKSKALSLGAKNISLACRALKFMYSPCPFSALPIEVTS